MTSNKFTSGKRSTKTPPVCKKAPGLPWQCPPGLPSLFRGEAHFKVYSTGDLFDDITGDIILEALSPVDWYGDLTVQAISPSLITTAKIEIEWEWFNTTCKSRLTTLVTIATVPPHADGFQQNFTYKNGLPIYYDSGYTHMQLGVNFGQIIIHPF